MAKKAARSKARARALKKPASKADRPIPYVPTVLDPPFEAKLVDARYFTALEDLLDAVEVLFEGSLTMTNVERTEVAYQEAARLAERQDRYRTDAEVGPRSLKRYTLTLRDNRRRA